VAAGLAVSQPAAAQSIRTLTSTRDLRIDAAEHDLTPITWLAVSAAGGIVINQPQDGPIRFFDAAGKALGAFGRKGQGPGEFQSSSRAGWVGDTLWVLDFQTRRFTLVSPDRTLARTVPWLATLRGDLPPHVTAQRVTSSFPQAYLADGSQLLSLSVGDAGQSGLVPGYGAPIARADADGNLIRLVAWRPEDGCTVSLTFTGGGFGSARVPYCFGSITDVSPGGDRLVSVHAERRGRDMYRVSVMQATGDTLFSRSYSYRSVAIPKSVGDSVLNQLSTRGPAEFRAAWRSMTIPPNYPPISRVMLGRDATIWLEEYTTSGDRLWLILDARGDAVGRIAVPRTVRLLAAARTAFWGTDTDEDDLQHVVRYRVSQ
jgi:hypothetical protein